jgi:DNA-binding protein YbaB
MGMFDNVKKMQELKKMTDEMNKMEFTASSKDGKIKATVKGDFTTKSLELDPSLMDGSMKIEAIQKLIVETINRALSEARGTIQKRTQKMAKEMGIGFK